jgi:hypothetical protein
LYIQNSENLIINNGNQLELNNKKPKGMCYL